MKESIKMIVAAVAIYAVLIGIYWIAKYIK